MTLKEILKQLVVSGQREMGTDWCSKMINEIDKLGIKEIKKVTKETDRLASTSFTDDGNGNCIHCGSRPGNHLYATERCRKKKSE